MPTSNLGNVVGLLKLLDAPVKEDILWAKVLDGGFPDETALYKHSVIENSWTPFDSSDNFYLTPVTSVDQNTPPVSPTLGASYLLGNTPTGAWTGKAYNHARWYGHSWVFNPPKQGSMARSITSISINYVYDSSTKWTVVDTVLDFGPGTAGQLINYQSGAWTKVVQLKDTGGVNNINISTRFLQDTGGVNSVLWGVRQLKRSANTLAADWQNSKLIDSAEVSAIDWQNRVLTDNNETDSIDWKNRILYRGLFSPITVLSWEDLLMKDSDGVDSVLWGDRSLYDSSANLSADWENHTLRGAGTENIRIDWQQMYLYDGNEVGAISWGTRNLRNTSNTATLDWENQELISVAGDPVLNWESKNIFDSTSNLSVDWESRILYDDTSTEVLNWVTKTLKAGGSTLIEWELGKIYWGGALVYDWGVGKIYDGSTQESIDFNNRELSDSAAGAVMNWATSAKLQIYNDVSLETVGKGFKIKEGSNAKMGVATLVGGTVVVSTTAVTANSRIFLTANGGTLLNIGSPYVSARSAGTSFTISSTNVLDTASVAWIIVDPS